MQCAIYVQPPHVSQIYLLPSIPTDVTLISTAHVPNFNSCCLVFRPCWLPPQPGFQRPAMVTLHWFPVSNRKRIENWAVLFTDNLCHMSQMFSKYFSMNGWIRAWKNKLQPFSLRTSYLFPFFLNNNRYTIRKDGILIKFPFGRLWGSF